MKISRLNLFALFYFIQFFSFCQPFTGIVVNSKNEPVPFASISVIKSSKGTISNLKGEFYLPNLQKGMEIKISCIGYNPFYFTITDTSENLIFKLEENLNQFNDIIIIPDSALKMILKKSFVRIEKNYPVNPFSLIGYYSELEHTESGKTIYAGEALMEVYQEGYNNRNDKGQFKILNLRIFNNAMKDSINRVYWNGGPFIAERIDVVKNRFDFIDYRNFNKLYTYKIEEEDKFNGDTVYIISFKSIKEGGKNGTITILKDSGAYLKISWFEEGEKQKLISPIVRELSKYTIQYNKVDSLWVLGYADFEMKTSNRKNMETSKIKIIFVSDTANLKSKPIEYNERLIESVFSIKKNENPEIFNNYPNYIQNYSKIENEVNFRENFNFSKNSESKSNDFKSTLISNLIKLKFDFGLGVFVNNNFLQTSKANNQINLFFGQRVSSCTKLDLSYALNRHNLFYFEKISIDKSNDLKVKQINIGYIYNILVKKHGNPAFLQPTIGVGRLGSFSNLGLFSGKNLEIEGIRTLSDNLSLTSNQRNMALILGLNFDFKFNKFEIALEPRINWNFRNKLEIFNTNGLMSEVILLNEFNKQYKINYSFNIIFNLSK